MSWEGVIDPRDRRDLLLPTQHIGVVLRQRADLTGVGPGRRLDAEGRAYPAIAGGARIGTPSGRVTTQKPKSIATVPPEGSPGQPVAARSRSPLPRRRARDRAARHSTASLGGGRGWRTPRHSPTPARGTAGAPGRRAIHRGRRSRGARGAPEQWPSRNSAGVTRSSWLARRSAICASTGNPSRICPTMLGAPTASAVARPIQGQGVSSAVRSGEAAPRPRSRGR